MLIGDKEKCEYYFKINVIPLKKGIVFRGGGRCTFTGGKPRNYHEIVLIQFCSQATSETRRGSFQANNWINKG